ncbi:MAG: sensor histidine kinase [Actinomycetes bacterium]
MDWPRFARAADALVVAVVAGWGQLAVWTADPGTLAGGRPVHALLAAVATVPLFVRRSRPLLALLLVFGAGWLHDELGGTSGVLWFGLCLALYALGAHADRWSLVAGSAFAAAGVLTYDIPRLLAGEALDSVLPAWFILAGLVGLGRWMRNRRRETEQLQARAVRTDQQVAEEAARAVTDERARIARELHDLVAHSMGVIVIQAQAGQRAVDTDPGTARAALQAIETSGRQGLAEMRRLLELLTSRDDGSVTPQPSLRGLGDLVTQVRSAGLPVVLETVGDLTALPAGVDLAAYRIVQEALTNVLKHAGPATVRVCLRRRGSVLEVEVCDDGRGSAQEPAPAGAGHGHVGMRERATLYGGAVETGNLPGGGYRVWARLPVDGAAA